MKASSGNNEATCKISTTKTTDSIRHFFEKDKNSDQIAKQNQEYLISMSNQKKNHVELYETKLYHTVKDSLVNISHTKTLS